MTNWEQEKLAQRPGEFTIISENTVMQRRNIQQVEHEEQYDHPAYKEYICECRKLTNTEYQQILQKLADERMNDIEDIIADIVGGTE